jgi:hypothetical protein
MNRGTVVLVRGSVVDVRFDERLPPIFSVLHAGAKEKIVIEVMEQLDARRVRGIALTPTQAWREEWRSRIGNWSWTADFCEPSAPPPLAKGHPRADLYTNS